MPHERMQLNARSPLAMYARILDPNKSPSSPSHTRWGPSGEEVDYFSHHAVAA